MYTAVRTLKMKACRKLTRISKPVMATRSPNENGTMMTVTFAAHNIAVTGTGKTPEAARAGAVLTRNGTRFGFLAYTFDQRNGNHTDDDPRVAEMDFNTLQEDIRALRARCDAVTRAGHAQTRDAVQEASAKLRGLLDPRVRAGRRQQEHRGQSVRARRRQPRLRLLRRQVGDQHTGDAGLSASGSERRQPVLVHRVVVGHDDEGDVDVQPGQVGDDPLRRSTRSQRGLRGRLDHRSVHDGIGERDADLDRHRAGAFERLHHAQRVIERRVARRQERDQPGRARLGRERLRQP